MLARGPRPVILHHARLLARAGARQPPTCAAGAVRRTDEEGLRIGEIYVSTDVETDGPIPGVYSMLSIGSAAYLADKTLVARLHGEPRNAARRGQHPDTMEWWKTQPEAWEASPQDPQPPEQAMRDYLAWLKALPGEPVFVAYPAAFDFMFVCWYLNRFTGENPFGWQALDIKTYAMALLGTDFLDTVKRQHAPPLVRRPPLHAQGARRRHLAGRALLQHARRTQAEAGRARMTAADVTTLFLGLVEGRHGHFRLESGYHGRLWFDLDPLFSEPRRVEPFVGALAASLRQYEVGAVSGPLLGGALLAQLVAHALGAEFYFTRRGDDAEASAGSTARATVCRRRCASA